MTNQYTLTQQRRRKHLEAEIRVSAHTMGTNLKAIHDEILYKWTHKTWEDYCLDVFGIVARHANRLIKHGKILRLLEDDSSVHDTIIVAPIGDTDDQNPQTDTPESQYEPESDESDDVVDIIVPETATRILAGLPDDVAKRILQEAMDDAATNNITRVTAKAVGALVDEWKADNHTDTIEEPEEIGSSHASIVKDAIGRDVPLHLSVDHSAATSINSVANKLNAIKRDVDKLADEAGGQFVPQSEIHQYFTKLKGLISQSRYWSECPRCCGTVKPECNRCDGNGFIPFKHRGALSSEEQEWLGVS